MRPWGSGASLIPSAESGMSSDTGPRDPAAVTTSSDAGTSTALVLVATSDAGTREQLLRAVSLSGVSVIRAADGLEALALARRVDLDLVVLDTFLAVLDGTSTCARIRNMSMARQPSIMLVGVASERMAEVGFEAGADDVARKPLHVAVLRRRLAGLLDRKQAGDRLRLLERAMEGAMSGITILDARTGEYPVRYVNATFANMTGYTKAELQGRNLRLLVGPETDVAALSEMRESLTRGRACRTILRNYRKDGVTFWNELSMAPLRDEAGLLTQWVGIQTDASVRVRAGELALAQQELEDLVERRTRELGDVLARLEKRRRFTENILNALTGGVITTDAAGAISFANRTALGNLKLSPSDCLGRPVAEVLGDDDELAQALANHGGREAYKLECRLSSPSGASLRVGMAIVPAPEEFREEFGMVFLFRDLTGEKPYGWSVQEPEKASSATADPAPGFQPEPDGESVPEQGDSLAPSESITQVAAQLLLRRALEALQARPERVPRRPLMENPLQEFPSVRVQERPVVEALVGLLEAGLELAGEAGRVRVRLASAESPSGGSSPDRIQVVLKSEAGPPEPWPKGVKLNLDFARRLLTGSSGSLEVSTSPDGAWRLSVFLPAASAGT